MRKAASILVLASVVLFSAPQVLACGDKYLSVGRGGRFQRGYVSVRPVSIAVLKSSATGQKIFLSRLKLAGHRVEIVDDLQGMKKRVAAGTFEVVLADYEKAAEVNSVLQTLSSHPLFLPVVTSGSGNAAAAHREYGCLLNEKSNSRTQNFLAVLDEAVDAKRRAQPVKCDLPKS